MRATYKLGLALARAISNPANRVKIARTIERVHRGIVHAIDISRVAEMIRDHVHHEILSHANNQQSIGLTQKEGN